MQKTFHRLSRGLLSLSQVYMRIIRPFSGGPFSPPHGPLHFIEGSRLLNFLPFSNNISVPWVSLRKGHLVLPKTPHATIILYTYNQDPELEFPPEQFSQRIFGRIFLRLHTTGNKLLPVHLYAQHATIPFEGFTERCAERNEIPWMYKEREREKWTVSGNWKEWVNEKTSL